MRNNTMMMQMMMMQALKQVSPELLAMVEEEARKRGMSDEDINAGKAYINQVQKGVEK